jgi:site-specific recombinase XerD
VGVGSSRKMGAELLEVAEVLGHTDIRVTRGYTDVAAVAKREALERPRMR